jgi:hypothetical protein
VPPLIRRLRLAGRKPSGLEEDLAHLEARTATAPRQHSWSVSTAWSRGTVPVMGTVALAVACEDDRSRVSGCDEDQPG